MQDYGFLHKSEVPVEISLEELRNCFENGRSLRKKTISTKFNLCLIHAQDLLNMTELRLSPGIKYSIRIQTTNGSG